MLNAQNQAAGGLNTTRPPERMVKRVERVVKLHGGAVLRFDTSMFPVLIIPISDRVSYQAFGGCKAPVEVLTRLAAVSPDHFTRRNALNVYAGAKAALKECFGDTSAHPEAYRHLPRILLRLLSRPPTDRTFPSGVNLQVTLARPDGTIVASEAPGPPPHLQHATAVVAQIKAGLAGLRELTPQAEWTSASVAQRVEAALGKYRRIIALAQSGYHVREISVMTRTSPLSCQRWIGGGVPHAIEMWSSNQAVGDHLGKAFRRESVERAYFLGAFGGTARFAASSDFIDFKHTREAPLNRLATVGMALGLQAVPSQISIDGRAYYKIIFYSRELVRVMNRLTECNSKVPWECILEESERIAYLQGFFDFAGGVVGSQRVNVEKTNKSQLICDVAQLLSTFGVYPTVRLTRNAAFSITSPRDVARLIELGAHSTDEKDKELLEGIAAKKARDVHSLETYVRVKGLAEQGLSTREIRAATGLDRETVRTWVDRGVAPLSYQRMVALQELNRENLDVNTIGYAYRELGLHPESARNLGKQLKFAELRDRLAKIDRLPTRDGTVSLLFASASAFAAELQERSTDLYDRPIAQNSKRNLPSERKFGDPEEAYLEQVRAIVLPSRHELEASLREIWAVKLRMYSMALRHSKGQLLVLRRLQNIRSTDLVAALTPEFHSQREAYYEYRKTGSTACLADVSGRVGDRFAEEFAKHSAGGFGGKSFALFEDVCSILYRTVNSTLGRFGIVSAGRPKVDLHTVEQAAGMSWEHMVRSEQQMRMLYDERDCRVNELWERLLPLTLGHLRRFRFGGLDFEELSFAANRGLRAAILRVRPDLSESFRSYARAYVKYFIKAAIVARAQSPKEYALDDRARSNCSTPPKIVIADDLKGKIASALSELPPLEAEIVKLASGYEGPALGDAEIATTLNIADSLVVELKNRAFATLAERLQSV